MRLFRYARVLKILALSLLALSASVYAQQGPLPVCATVPDLGSLVREIGGEQVSATVFAKGTEDPHFVESRPSFVRAMNQCEIYIQMGMDMEIGWAPILLQNSRNPRIQPGNPGYLDASLAISPLGVPTGEITRLMGDVHPGGNPHYLLDPLNGLSVAGLIRDRLIELRPGQRAHFEDRYKEFARRLAGALVGEELASRYGIEDVRKLARLYEHGRLLEFLEDQGEAGLLGGWIGLMQPYFGTRVVDDHDMWPYFARRFGIEVIGHMEPKPGIPPTIRHLRDLISRMQAENVRVVITSAYYDPRHARFLAGNTDARIVPLAHQVGARPGTDDYLGMNDYNVRQLAAALGGGG